MGMDFRGLQVWKQVWEMTFLVWNRVRIWRTGFHSPTKNSQEYPWGQITPFSLIKQWKISWITWSRAIADWWPRGALPFLVYKGMCHWTGYGFFTSLSQKGYIISCETINRVLPVVLNRLCILGFFCPKKGQGWWKMFFRLFIWLDGWSKTRIRTQDYFYRGVIYGDLLDISPWRNLLRSILGLFQTRATAVPNR